MSPTCCEWPQCLQEKVGCVSSGVEEGGHDFYSLLGKLGSIILYCGGWGNTTGTQRERPSAKQRGDSGAGEPASSEEFSSPNLRVVILKTKRMGEWPATIVWPVLSRPWTCWASPSAEACWWETENYKAFVLSCQAFVSSQESKEEAGLLGNSLSLLPSHGPSPCLSAYLGLPSFSKISMSTYTSISLLHPCQHLWLSIVFILAMLEGCYCIIVSDWCVYVRVWCVYVCVFIPFCGARNRTHSFTNTKQMFYSWATSPGLSLWF